MKRREFLKRVGLASMAAAAGGLHTLAARKRRPNIVFIMTDQQFAETMSCRVGNRYINTPALDSLAAGGMLFTRAYAPNPLCMPARGSIFSGRYPHETQIQSNKRRELDLDEFPAMGTYFKNAGYDTGYVGKWHLCYNQKDKTQHGFDVMDVLHGNGHDDEIPAPAVEFIKKQRQKPFLLVVSFSNPHDMCQLARFQKLPSGGIGDPPPLADRPPLPPNHLPPADETDTMTLMRKSYHNTSTFPVGDYDEDKWRRLIWGYYRLVEKVDALIGKVLTALKDSGREESTLVIFTSDHGDCHSAHRFNQKTVFYDESARVPLILSYKGFIRSGATDKLINTGLDIMPTMLDYAGIEQPKKMPGASLRSIAEGRAPTSWRKYVVSQNYMVQGGPVNGKAPKVKGRMVRSDRYKYCIYDTGKRRQALFDMQNDPGETKNLATAPLYAKVLNQHRAHLKEHALRYKDTVALAMLDA